MAKTIHQIDDDRIVGWRIECPACGCSHLFETDQHPHVPIRGGTGWQFNGDVNLPTFSPSMLVTSEMWTPPVTHENLDEWKEKPWPQSKVKTVCHSFVRDGKIEFLGDCTHDLKGQTVDLPEID